MKDLLELIGIIAVVYFICDPHGCAGCAQSYRNAAVDIVRGKE